MPEGVDLMATVDSLVPAATQFLVRVAGEQRLTTFGEVAAEIGTHHRVVTRVLWKIHHRCTEHGWPPLTALVVSKRAAASGEGLADQPHGDRLEQAARWRELLNSIYDFDWQAALRDQ
jgi:hypothetical protein